ncbi:demethylspheroidene O-methyltransferase [Litoreibacter ponti]|uniref:Demethylspheroidene O-methyltransferase n=1 Tax=Litoreibacter ponti TaxID=1510457 RepID=A0A2T6BPF9_9RHOB|nr:methyltransferase [Litoreibacter ponti]PTX57955.1 demethylspheroidene O-methyltransferase [Litoreibacter ponti]
MTALDHEPMPRSPAKRRGLHQWLMRRIADPGFQSWASRFPLTKRASRKDGERLFDLVSGFAYSQTLLACVELGLFEALEQEPATPEQLAHKLGLAPDRMRLLCQAAAGLDLIQRRGESYRLSRLGAASLGVPGLLDMIRHHAVFYRDLADPVALLRGETQPELAEFWPYVRGESATEIPGQQASTYSDLMAQTQGLVAEETLRTVSLSKVTKLMDVGGGTGAFLRAVRAHYPSLDLALFDLPPVIEVARAHVADHRIEPLGGSFHEALPTGADAISLVRVLYDHSDDTIAELLAKVFKALPSGGRLIISEPMSGGDAPTRAGDVYFALYTMAMTTGKARSADEICGMLAAQGFENMKKHSAPRPFLTSCITAIRP